METQFKKILLQKGLEKISDYQFRKVKFLLASELELSEKMMEDYDRIQLADRMFTRFPGPTCIEKLINILKDDSNDPNIPKIVSLLRKEKQNAIKRFKAGADPLQRKRKRDGASTSTPTSSSEVSVAPQDTADTPVVQETPGIPERAKDKRVPAKDSVTVMVLKCSESFNYESTEQGTESMFHALVATTNRFFWVTVLDMSVKECFKKNSVLIISGHFENRGVLEVSRSSSVFLAHDQIQVPSSVMRKAREIPKIASIKATPGIFVYGLYELVKKTEHKTNTVYEIRDETGNIGVVGRGKWHRLPCEARDKLRLFYFRLGTANYKPILQSQKHSLIQATLITNHRPLPVVEGSDHPGGQDQEKLKPRHASAGYDIPICRPVLSDQFNTKSPLE